MSSTPFSPEPARNRQSVASYGTYPEAQAAVDRLSDDGFPVQRLAIVGTDLRLVEQVVGRVDVGRAAILGAASGAMTGLLFGLILGLFLVDDDVSPFAAILWGVLLGAVIGAIFGAIDHLTTGGKRDFASVSGLQASRYEVQADDEVADDARARLAQVPSSPAPSQGSSPLPPPRP